MASRFFRSPMTEPGYTSVPDSVNEERFKTFADRIRQWGGGGPGLAPRRRDKYSYEEFFGSPPYGNAPYQATETVDSLEGPVMDDGWEPPTPPSSPHFYMKGGKLFASDEVAGMEEGQRRSLLDAFIAANPEMQAGVDAWKKKQSTSHPGTPRTSGDWQAEQKPIKSTMAKPASIRATGGDRGGVPLESPPPLPPENRPTSLGKSAVAVGKGRPWYESFRGMDSGYGVSPDEIMDMDQPYDSEYNKRQLAGAKRAYGDAATALIPVGEIASAARRLPYVYRYAGGAGRLKLAERSREAAKELVDFAKWRKRTRFAFQNTGNTPPPASGVGFDWPAY